MNPIPQTSSATQADASPISAKTRLRGVGGMLVGTLLAVACAIALVYLQGGMTTGTAERDGLLVAQTGYLMLFGVMFVIAGAQKFRKGGISKPFGLALFAMMVGFVNLPWLWKMF